MTTLLLLLPLALAFQPKQPQQLLMFFGFSEDGRSFAWTVASPDQKAKAFKVATAGAAEPQTIALDSKGGFAKAKAMIKAKGFSPVRHAWTGELKLDARLGETPPKLFLLRGATRVAVPVGTQPYPGARAPVLLGASSDKKFVVIVVPPTTIYGPANKADFAAAFVVAVPPAAP